MRMARYLMAIVLSTDSARIAQPAAQVAPKPDKQLVACSRAFVTHWQTKTSLINSSLVL